MGLLDQFGSLDDDQSQGLLSAGLHMMAASGPSHRPSNFGLAALQGLHGYQDTIQSAKKRRLMEQEAAQMAQMRGLQIQGLEGDQAIKQQQRERMERIRNQLTPGANLGAGQPAQAASGPEAGIVSPTANEPDWMTAYRSQAPAPVAASAPAPGAAQAGNASPTQATVAQFMRAAQVYAAEGDIDGANKMLEQAAKFRSKFDTTPRVMKKGGKLVNVLVNDEGQQQEMPYEVAEKLNYQDTGGETVGLGEYSGAVQARLGNTQSPNNAATVSASYANAAATRSIAEATRDAARITRDQATEMKLGDDYRAQSKGFKEVSDAYRTINATLDKATLSPAATLAGATKFMKLLDPGSVVRESELGMALAATGVFDRATNYHNTLLRGKVLTPAQAADFKRITGQIYKAAQQSQQAIDQNYRKQAEAYGLRPDIVVQDLGQNATPRSEIPQGAANLLKLNPKLRDQFDAKYGAGSAASILGK